MGSELEKRGGGVEALKGLVKKGPSALDALRNQAIADANVQEALVLLLDASWSMDGLAGEGSYESALEASKRAAKALTDASQASHIGVIAFSSNVDLLTRVANKSIAMTVIDRISSNGRTSMKAGLLAAYEELDTAKAAYQVKRVILLTDGSPTDCMIDELFVIAKRAKEGKGYILDTIGFGAGADVAGLKLLAEAGGGVYSEASNAEQLVKSFIMLEAKTRGLLGAGAR